MPNQEHGKQTEEEDGHHPRQRPRQRKQEEEIPDPDADNNATSRTFSLCVSPHEPGQFGERGQKWRRVCLDDQDPEPGSQMPLAANATAAIAAAAVWSRGAEMAPVKPAVRAKADRELGKAAEQLQAWYDVPLLEKAWASTAAGRPGSLDLLVSFNQPNLRANAKRTFVSSVFLPDAASRPQEQRWSPFPVELSGASLLAPSPSGTKLLVVRKPDDPGSATAATLEIWGRGRLLQDLPVGAALHGSVYTDGWFEGVAWSPQEDRVAYVAEAPASSSPRPVFGANAESDPGAWKGQGDWTEDWGECYIGKRRPALFVANLGSGRVREVPGIPPDISVGQVVWAPRAGHAHGVQESLVFVGWPRESTNFSTPRQLGMKHCYNRPCALYAIQAPKAEVEAGTDDEAEAEEDAAEAEDDVGLGLVRLTDLLSSAFSPSFTPDGRNLCFLSAQSAVDTGVHCSTTSLHSLAWPPPAPEDGKARSKARVLIPVVQESEGAEFPGLYSLGFAARPWLETSQRTETSQSTETSPFLVLSSPWRSTQVILAVDVGSGKVERISPGDSAWSWSLLGVHGEWVIAAASSPASPPVLKLGFRRGDGEGKEKWVWIDVPAPQLSVEEVVEKTLSSISFRILQLPGGAGESIFVERKREEEAEAEEGKAGPRPLILVLHGGPHSVSTTGFSRASTFLSGLGFNLLHVNYRGSLGFGEAALQSLPGKAGRQDVDDVLAALQQVVGLGLADSERVAVLGGSHGGFLATHLIGQAPDLFRTAAVRNPATNLSSMVGITDIPDWCFVEAAGRKGKDGYTEAPSDQDLARFYQVSPIAHVGSVKVPTLFMLGAQDRRVPVSTGFQYVHALRQRGLEVKTIVFPEDCHAIDKPQSDFESFANIGAWFSRFLLDS